MGDDWGETAAEEAPSVEVKLFGRWNPDDVQINDISLAVSCTRLDESTDNYCCILITAHFVKDYIAVKENHAVFLPHTAGRYAAKRFRKSQASCVCYWILY